MNGKSAVNKKQDSLNQDWQSSKFTSVERAKHLLETGLHADCEFFVGDGVSTVKELVKAHQIFLAMSSPVFEVMFYGTMMTQAANSNKIVPITIPDLTPSSFRELLQYIYTDFVDLQTMDQAIDLCYAAKKYIFPNLVAKCVKYMVDNLTTAHIYRVLEFSILIDDEHLKTKCLSLVREKTRESLCHLGFRNVSESAVLAIVKDDALNIRELDLFADVLRWAKNQCTQRGLTIIRPNIRQVLGDIIGEIRFLSMKPEEFASSPVLSGILTEKECFVIYQNLINPRSLPMPHHMSSCRKQRRFSPEVNSGESRINTNEFFYCIRKIKNEIFLQKRGKVDLVTEFTANQTIKIKGIILTEILTENPEFPNESQDFKIECHLSDHSGTRLASAYLSKHALPRQSFTLEPVFNIPARVKRNCKYSISVSVDAPSQWVRFLLGKAASPVESFQGVEFRFFTQVQETRDGLVRGVKFSLW